MLEVLKCNHNYCNVVKWLSIKTIFKNCLDAETTVLVNVDSTSCDGSGSSRNWYVLALIKLSLRGLTWQPNTFSDIFIGHLIKNAIATQNDKVMLFWNLKCVYVWLSCHYVRVPPSEFKLRLWIAKSPTNRKPAWQDTNWSNYELWLFFGWSSLCITLLSVALALSRRSLVNLPTSLYNSLVLVHIRRLVISR